MRSRTPASRERREERLHRGALRRLSTTRKVVVLGRERQEAETVECARPTRSRRPSRRGPARPRRRPRCASAAGCRSPAGRLRLQQLVDQHARAGAGIAVDHQAGRIGERGRERLAAALRPSKRASPGRNTMPCMRCQPCTSASPSAAADARCRCRSPDRGDARGARSHSPRRAAATPPRLPTAIVRAVRPRSASAPSTDVERDAVAAHDHEIGHARGLPDQRHARARAGIERRRQRVDLEEAVGLREARHRARALGGRKRDQPVLARRPAPPARIPCGRAPRRCAPAPRPRCVRAASGGRPGERADHRRDEGVEGEDRRGRETRAAPRPACRRRPRGRAACRA